MRFPFPPSEPVAAAAMGAAALLAMEEQASAPAASADVNVATAAAVVETLVALSSVPVEVPEESIVVAPEEPRPIPVEAREAALGPDLALPTETVVDPGPAPIVKPRPRAKRKVIAFPRPVQTAGMAPGLADPVLPEHPRILDVPEELEAFPSTPYLDGLQFGSNSQPVSAGQIDHIELPFRAAAVSQRIYAAFVDCALVGLATAAFAAVSYKMLPKLVITKPLLLTAAAVPVLFWAIYQYLLTVYAGTTVGMRVAGIRLSSFKGAHPKWRNRRSRVLALYFSAASLSMGLLWALVDVDKLCWHDRISRTYLARRQGQ